MSSLYKDPFLPIKMNGKKQDSDAAAKEWVKEMKKRFGTEPRHVEKTEARIAEMVAKGWVMVDENMAKSGLTGMVLMLPRDEKIIPADNREKARRRAIADNAYQQGNADGYKQRVNISQERNDLERI